MPIIPPVPPDLWLAFLLGLIDFAQIAQYFPHF